MAKRYRNYVFTNFDLDNNLYDLFKPAYLAFGVETCPTTGRQHQQGWLHWTDAKTVNATRKLLKVHCEPMLGSIEQNLNYCGKEGAIQEFGIRPMTNDDKGRAEKLRWKAAIDLARENRIDEVDADIQLRYYSTLKQMGVDHAEAPIKLDEPCGIWIYGEANAGKTYYTHEKYPKHYIKPKNKWWNSYRRDREEHGTIVIQDIGHDEVKWMVPFLLEWADEYPFNAEMKGSSMIIRPKLVVVTSQWKIDELDIHERSKVALNRRFKKIHMVNFKQQFNIE